MARADWPVSIIWDHQIPDSMTHFILCGASVLVLALCLLTLHDISFCIPMSKSLTVASNSGTLSERMQSLLQYLDSCPYEFPMTDLDTLESEIQISDLIFTKLLNHDELPEDLQPYFHIWSQEGNLVQDTDPRPDGPIPHFNEMHCIPTDAVIDSQHEHGMTQPGEWTSHLSFWSSLPENV